MDTKKHLEDLSYLASVEAGRAGEAAGLADTDAANRDAHLVTAREAAGKATAAAVEAEQSLAHARNEAHGARARARKAGALTAAHEQAVDHVEQELRSIAQIARGFANAARSFARSGLDAHDERVRAATIAKIERVEIPAARSVAEAEALRADARWLRAQAREVAS